MPFSRAARLAFQLPEQSRFKLKLAPSNEWGWQEMLLNKVSYYLQILAWQNTEDAHSKHPTHQPELWLPNFVPKPEKPKNNQDEQAMDLEDLKAFLKRPREGAKVESNE